MSDDDLLMQPGKGTVETPADELFARAETMRRAGEALLSHAAQREEAAAEALKAVLQMKAEGHAAIAKALLWKDAAEKLRSAV